MGRRWCWRRWCGGRWRRGPAGVGGEAGAAGGVYAASVSGGADRFDAGGGGGGFDCGADAGAGAGGGAADGWGDGAEGGSGEGGVAALDCAAGGGDGFRVGGAGRRGDCAAGVIARAIGEVERPLAELAASFRRGQLLRNGAAIALIGPPNAGKSSLFNRLLERERAIVTPVPGTTRDTVEESVALGGIPLRLIDTAGLRGGPDGGDGCGGAAWGSRGRTRRWRMRIWCC
jgi:hypothetical protein